MSKNLVRVTVLMIGFVLTGSILSFDLLVRAQDPANQNSNPNTSTQTRNSNTGKRRTTKSRGNANTGGEVTATAPAETTAPSAASQETPTTKDQTTTKTKSGRRGSRSARASAAGEPTDLSGTYAGSFNCDVAGLSGETTLTITGNQ